MTMDEHDRAALATSVDVVLALLKGAERRTSFPAPGEDASHCDAENEESKRRGIASERTYFEELRARIGADDMHRAPVRHQALEVALGVLPTMWGGEEDDTEQLHEMYVESWNESDS